MAQKNRNNITAAVETNIYDNNNKEILAAMVRSVFEDYRDSFFNLIDDKLKNMKYEGNTTLQQHLNSIVGALPIYGIVLGVNVGERLRSYTTAGIIKSAEGKERAGPDFLLEINFSQSVSNRRLIPVLTTARSDYNTHNDIANPIIRRISGTRIHLAMRQLANAAQSLDIEIIAI